MSYHLCFERLGKIEEPLPDVLDMKDIEHRYYCIDVKSADEWIKEIGLLRTVRYPYVSIYELCEKLLGEKAGSYTYKNRRGNNGYECFDKDGLRIGEITENDVAANTETREKKAYLFECEHIAEIREPWFIEISEGLISYEQMLDVVKKCVEECETGYPSQYHEVLPELMKVLFHLKDGETVWCRKD